MQSSINNKHRLEIFPVSSKLPLPEIMDKVMDGATYSFSYETRFSNKEPLLVCYAKSTIMYHTFPLIQFGLSDLM